MKPSWSLTLDVTWSIFWRFIVFYFGTILASAVPAGVVLGLMHAVGEARLVGQVAGVIIVFPALMLAVRGALADSFRFQEEPNQTPQRNAGSRPSSDDDSAVGTPPLLGPRG